MATAHYRGLKLRRSGAASRVSAAPLSVSRRGGRGFAVHVAVLILAMGAGAAWALHLGQDIGWDLRLYHFYNPYALLHGRFGWDFEPADLQSYLNPLLDLPTYYLIQNHSPRVVGASLGALQGVNVWLVFEIAALLLRARVRAAPVRGMLALTAGAGAFFGGLARSEFGATLGDNLASIPILAGVLIILKSAGQDLSERASTWTRRAGYAVAGLGVGLKLTNVPMGIALVAAAGVFGNSVRQRALNIAWGALSIAVGTLVTAGYWFVLLWKDWGNPTFPFYNGIFHSSYFPDFNFTDHRYVPATWGRLFDTPLRMARTSITTTEFPMREPNFAAVLFALAAAAAVVAVRRGRARAPSREVSGTRTIDLFLVVFFLVSFSIWAAEFGIARYVVATELVSAPIILIALMWMFDDVRYIGVTFLAVVVALSVYTKPPTWGRIPWKSNYFGPGIAARLQQARGTVLLPGYSPIGFLVPYLPQDSRVLRINGTIQDPAMATNKYRERLQKAIVQQQQRGDRFYALETWSGAEFERTALLRIGYRNASCIDITTHFGNEFRLCSLVRI